MKEPKNLADMFTEVENLIHFVTFGKVKLDEVDKQVDTLENQINGMSEKGVLEKLMQESRCLQSSIQATNESLTEWKNKGSGYLSVIHQLASDPISRAQGMASKLQQLEDKTRNLLDLIKAQSTRIVKLQHVITQINQIASEKLITLLPNFERAKDPQLAGKIASSE